MSLSNTSQRYGTVTKTFHWITAILILALMPLGGIASDLPIGTEEEIARVFLLFSIHKTLGVTVFFVALLRILWALSQVKPGGLHPERRAETLLAEIVHWLLYGSLVLVPLTGWIHHAALEGFAPIWWPFGQSLPFVPKDAAVAEVFGSLHWVFTKILPASIILHVAGALKHHFVDKDVTLRRMWFGKTDVPNIPPHRSPAAAPIIALLIFGLATAAVVRSGGEAHGSALASVQSDWQVQSGDINIVVQQSGNDVEGHFANWTAAIAFDPNATGTKGNVTTTIDITSLTLGSLTSQAMGTDFFDAATHPTAIFSADITAADDGTFVATGDLTLKGATVPVTLPFELEINDGIATMSGNTVLDRGAFAIGSGTDAATLAPQVSVMITLTAQRAQ